MNVQCAKHNKISKKNEIVTESVVLMQETVTLVGLMPKEKNISSIGLM
jgi:hypothetical protein